MSERTFERLEDVIDEKEYEIGQLKEKQEKQEYADEWRWKNPRTLTKEENLDLPVPRLEMRYRSFSNDNYNFAIDYGLVYEHLIDGIIFMPMGSTKCTNRERYEKSFDTPFRDGAHIRNEMMQLNLQGFVVSGTKYKKISTLKEDCPGGLLSKIYYRETK